MALLLRLLQLGPPALPLEVDGRTGWDLAALLPLHRAVSWHASNRDAAGLLPRHAQLYAELVAALPPGSYTSRQRRAPGLLSIYV